MIPWFYDSIPLSIKTQRNWSQLTLLHEETEGTNCLAWYKQILLLEFLVRLYRRANSDLQLERSPPFLLHLSMRTTQTNKRKLAANKTQVLLWFWKVPCYLGTVQNVKKPQAECYNHFRWTKKKTWYSTNCWMPLGPIEVSEASNWTLPIR